MTDANTQPKTIPQNSVTRDVMLRGKTVSAALKLLLTAIDKETCGLTQSELTTLRTKIEQDFDGIGMDIKEQLFRTVHESTVMAGGVIHFRPYP